MMTLKPIQTQASQSHSSPIFKVIFSIASIVAIVSITACDKSTAVAPSAEPEKSSAQMSAIEHAVTTISKPALDEIVGPRKVTINVQGVAEAGVTIRIKEAEIGGDTTMLNVSISFANRITDSVMLALLDTYIEDEKGARLHIKRPEKNRDFKIREGETLNTELVFMGRVNSNARSIKLVFNDGNESDNLVAPGLHIDVPLSDK